MTRQTFSAVLIFTAVCVVGLVAQSTQMPVNWKGLPEPFATESVRNNPTIIPQPEGAKLTVPAGFVVEEFMGGFSRPRFMILGPNREILISDNVQNGAVYVLKDGARTAIIEKLDRPYGLALNQGWLYVGEPTSVKRYRYDAATMRVTTPGEEIVSLAGMGSGHNTRTLAFNRAGTKLYLSVGSQSNVDLNEPAMRAAVHRFNPDGTGHETVATGLRNAVGLRFYPDTDDLWVSVHERDLAGRRSRARLRDAREGRRLLRLAVRLHRTSRGSAAQGCRAGKGAEHGVSRRAARWACRTARHPLLHRRAVPGEVSRRHVRGAARLVESFATSGL